MEHIADEHAATEAINPRRDLAAEIRALASAAVLTRVDTAAVERAAALVHQATAELATSARSGRYDGEAGLAPGASTNHIIWETHGAFGRSNPVAPPVFISEQPGHLEGTVTFGGAWEGGPGMVYGGFIAAVFDGMLGRAALSAGHLAVTKSLSVRYLRPTPLHTELRLESTTGTLDGDDLAVTASMWSGERCTAEAEAVFTRVDPSRYRT